MILLLYISYAVGMQLQLYEKVVRCYFVGDLPPSELFLPLMQPPIYDASLEKGKKKET